MKKFIIFQFVLAAMLVGGCTEEFDTPAPFKPEILIPNTTIAQLTSLPAKTTVEGDVIIWGKVISTDQYGNFYKSLFIEDNTGGLELKIGKTTLYNTYQLGDTIYVKAKHLVYGNYSLGAPDPTGKYDNSYIDAQLWINMTIFKGVEGPLVAPKVINSYTDINKDSYATLLTLKNMKYTPITGELPTWALANETSPGGNAKEQTFTFPDGTNTVVVRTSNFARFANKPVPPAGSTVNLTGILTTFNGKKQFFLNSLAGVEIL